jgi:hypothetical protein
VRAAGRVKKLLITELLPNARTKAEVFSTCAARALSLALVASQIRTPRVPYSCMHGLCALPVAAVASAPGGGASGAGAPQARSGAPKRGKKTSKRPKDAVAEADAALEGVPASASPASGASPGPPVSVSPTPIGSASSSPPDSALPSPPLGDWPPTVIEGGPSDDDRESDGMRAPDSELLTGR